MTVNITILEPLSCSQDGSHQRDRNVIVAMKRHSISNRKIGVKFACASHLSICFLSMIFHSTRSGSLEVVLCLLNEKGGV